MTHLKTLNSISLHELQAREASSTPTAYTPAMLRRYPPRFPNDADAITQARIDANEHRANIREASRTQKLTTAILFLIAYIATLCLFFRALLD